MSRWRRWWTVVRNPQADIRFGAHNVLGPGFSLHMPFGGTFVSGDRVEFRRNFRAEVGPTGRIEIGDDVRFTYDVLMQCDTTITIGPKAMFGQCAMIVDGNHRFRDYDVPILQQGYDYRSITIGEDAVVLTKGTVINNIGKRSIIGANAVVTNPIPDYCVAVGIPARVVEYYGPPEHRPPDLPA